MVFRALNTIKEILSISSIINKVIISEEREQKIVNGRVAQVS